MKQLKQFVPLAINTTLYDWLGIAAKAKPAALALKIEHLFSQDPVGSSWSTIGMVAPIDDQQYVHDLDGTARLLMFRINERNLPGAVRNEELAKRVKAFQERSGLPISKHEYAKLRDEVEDDLLPKAFIRRTLVPVLVYPDKMLICTVSQKKLDDVLRELFKLATVKDTVVFTPEYFRYAMSLPVVFKAIVTEDFNIYDGVNLTAGNALQLKGHDKRTIVVKDRETAGHEVQQLIDVEEYAVVELRMGWNLHGDDKPQVEFTMNERGHVKKVAMSDDMTKEFSKEDMHASAWIAAKTYSALLNDLVGAMGGFAQPEKTDDDLDL